MLLHKTRNEGWIFR